MMHDDAKDEPERLKRRPEKRDGRGLLGEDEVSQDDGKCAQDGA